MLALANQVEPMTSQHHLPALHGPSDQRRSIRLLPQAMQSGMLTHHLLRSTELWQSKTKTSCSARTITNCHRLFDPSPPGGVASCSIFLYFIVFSEDDPNHSSCSSATGRFGVPLPSEATITRGFYSFSTEDLFEQKQRGQE